MLVAAEPTPHAGYGSYSIGLISAKGRKPGFSYMAVWVFVPFFDIIMSSFGCSAPVKGLAGKIVFEMTLMCRVER